MNSKNSFRFKKIKLGELADISRGGSPRPIEKYITVDNSGLNWLRIGDIKPGSMYIYATKDKITKDGLSKTTMVKEGDFILSNSMSFGRPYIMKTSACIHDGWLALRNISHTKVNKLFLFYLLSSEKIQSKFESLAAGSGVQNLKKETVAGMYIDLPELSYQDDVVEFLQTWDSYQTNLNKKIELKKKIKNSLCESLITGKSRLNQFSNSWKKVLLSDRGTFFKGSGITKEQLASSGFNAVRYGELYTKHHLTIKKIYSFITLDTSKQSVQIRKGDIIFAGSGETINEIGKSAVYLADEPCYVGGDTIIFAPEKQNSIFLVYLLNSISVRKVLSKLGQGQSVVHLYKKDLQNLEVLLPSLEEQTAIANILTTADQEIEALEKKRNLIAAQKNFLLNKLITGEIRLPEFKENNE